MKNTTIASILIIIVSFMIAGYAYQTIDEDKIATHWNAQGNVDDYSGKFWGLFLFPIILVIMYLLFLLIPKIDPLKKNIKKFRKQYDLFILVMLSYASYVFILMILFNYGFQFNMAAMMIPALSLLFFYLGTFMKNIKRNWFIGIRTPWTISDDEVWRKTHLLGAKLFRISSIIIFLSIFFQKYFMWFLFVPLMITVIWLMIYSYVEYKKIKR